MNVNDDDPSDSEAMRALLRTDYHSVYEVSEDGTTYKRPASLRGCPVAKITEGSPYWNSNWLSLNDYLAKEQEEEAAKERTRVQRDLNPSNKTIRDDAKRHQDNVSKHRKIRQMFGETDFHPNQLVAKQYLPDEGLCEQEVMYTLGCKLSDFYVLHNKQLLTMEPWDFLRWRIGKLFIDRRPFLPANRASLRSVVFNIGGQQTEDPLFRQAVRRSAILQNRAASYGPKTKVGTYRVNGGEDNVKASSSAPRSAFRKKPDSQSRLWKKSKFRSTQKSAQIEAERKEMEERQKEAKRQRRAEKERDRPATTGYAGVNAYRQKKQDDKDGKDGNAPCGG